MGIIRGKQILFLLMVSSLALIGRMSFYTEKTLLVGLPRPDEEKEPLQPEKLEQLPATTDSYSSESTSWYFIVICIAVGAIVGVIILCCARKEGRTNSKGRDPERGEALISEKFKEEIESLKKENENFKEKIENLEKENESLKKENENFKKDNEILEARSYKADVVLDPKTAHPRLEVSQDGRSVRDTGNVSKVSNSEERFDSHTFILATCGFSEGKHYWEVEVGQKKKWDMGVAAESAPRKGNILLSPENGYWVIGLDGGKDYWARTDPWTRLKMSGKPTRIGIFLDTARGFLNFYDVDSKSKLHSFRISRPRKFYPLLSTGSLTPELDSETLTVQL